MKKYLPILLLILLSCTSSNKTMHQNITPPSGGWGGDKQGHRGCRGLMPENTIPAMLKALDLGVTTLEMDAHITKDGQVIISHDPYFNHDITTKPDGSYLDEKEEKNYVLYQMTYAQTQLFDVGLKPYPRFPRQQKLPAHKPLLADLIDSVELYSRLHKRELPFYNIETKSQPSTDNIYHPGPEEFVRLLMSVIQSKGIAARVIIQSFDPRTLQIVHQKFPAIQTALLVEGFDKRSLEMQCGELGFIPAIYSPEYSLVTEGLLKECHRQNIEVIPWTVDDKPTLEKFKSMGVDGIITDYPDLF